MCCQKRLEILFNSVTTLLGIFLHCHILTAFNFFQHCWFTLSTMLLATHDDLPRVDISAGYANLAFSRSLSLSHMLQKINCRLKLPLHAALCSCATVPTEICSHLVTAESILVFRAPVLLAG